MKAFSYIVDWSIFLILLFVFDVNWIVAFVVSYFVGAFIRTAFVSEEVIGADQ